MKKRFLTFALCTTIALNITGCITDGSAKEGEADSNATDNDIAEPSQNSEPVNNTDNNENNENNDESSKSSDDNNENDEDVLDASSEVKKILSEMEIQYS